MTEQSDEQIVARILSEDRDLFEILYRRYYPKAFSVAYGLTGQRETAEDLAQDILVKVFKTLEKFRGESLFSTWFYRIARNHCLNYCRGLKLTTDNIDDIDETRLHHLRVVRSAEDVTLQKEREDHIYRALLSLHLDDRELIVLKDVEGLSYGELAEQFGCSVGTVGSRLSRARELLARKLKGKI